MHRTRGLPTGILPACVHNNVITAPPKRVSKASSHNSIPTTTELKNINIFPHHEDKSTTQQTTFTMASNAGDSLPPYTPIDSSTPPTPSGSFDEPPAYGTLDIQEPALDTSAAVTPDGRVNININQKTSRISALLSSATTQRVSAPTAVPVAVPPSLTNIPPLNIVIQLIGSRGDIQPFLALAAVLHTQHHHRVRVATHPVFKSFVEDVPGLEFFSLGGDPGELMAFMVKNPGLMPGAETLRSGEVSKRRRGMAEMLEGAWRSCIEDGFIADAIIANPPSFAHVHCAEKLGVPLHLMFTMPWSATASFPHPLANIQSTNAEESVTNYLSYALVDMMTWQGLGDLVNRFREKTLGLEGVSTMWAPGMIARLKVPHTYAWSPALIPKPKDWPQELSIAGFFFLSLADNYTPPDDLSRFLAAGPPPVYIGFGSIVIDDPDALTNTILEAVKTSGCRALLSKGWGGIGVGDLPESIFLIDNCPHDWLFSQCAAVVHHGGAGTTAAAIRAGKPSIIVPFFGDQPFWGAMVHRAGAGPEPIHNKSLNATNLAAGITTALTEEVQRKAGELGEQIRHEPGARTGATAFHDSLTISRCDLLPSRIAVWRAPNGTKLSALAAALLASRNIITYPQLKLHRHTEWPTDTGPIDPISGGASALVGTMGSIMLAAGDFPKELFRAMSNKPGGPDTGTGMETTIAHGPNAVGSIAQIVGAGIKSPMDFTLSLARGFRNAPKLYGDTTVRPAPTITGYQSGLRASARELGLGVYDGISGLVTQPYQGAKEGGGAGLIKGAGRGIGGLVLKSGAAIWGVPGYAMQGMHREFLKHGAKDWSVQIIETRMAQGEREAHLVDDGTVEEVKRAWMTKEYSGGKEKRRFFAERKQKSSSVYGKEKAEAGKSQASTEDLRDYRDYQDPVLPSQPASSTDDEFERAVHESVRTTSTGNDEDDREVEEAIRASLAELQLHGQRSQTTAQDDEDEQLRLAITQSQQHKYPDPPYQPEDDADLQRAMQESQQHADPEDEDLRLALERSTLDQNAHDDDAELQRALRESQSAGKQPARDEEGEDEELQRAMRESLQLSERGGWDAYEGSGSGSGSGSRSGEKWRDV